MKTYTILLSLILCGLVSCQSINDNTQNRSKMDYTTGHTQKHEESEKNNDPDRILVNPSVSQTYLPIPELIDVRNTTQPVNIDITASTTEFFPGVLSQTKGYNGHYGGPTILTKKGQSVTFKWNNHLDDVTNIHKHGLLIHGNVDGGPQQTIPSNSSRTETLSINQEASTNWYHPHIMGLTAIQVYEGMAGFFIIEDENSQSLGLPNHYGVDDIPLMIQDRAFINGQMRYTAMDPSMLKAHSEMAGHNVSINMMKHDEMLGNTIVVNGAINVVKTVPKGWVRLRLLNGANARRMAFEFSDKRTFKVIASDGGFLEQPVSMDKITLSTGERYEILVDFSDGKTANLVTANKDSNVFDINVIELRVDPSLTSSGSLPKKKLNTITKYNPDEAEVTREFVLQEALSSGMMGINGKSMDMSRIDEYVAKDQLEKWVIIPAEEGHPFHIHGASFQIISQDGEVSKINQGWKDTLFVEDYAEVLVKFHHEATEEHPYMYHCHILEHEDMGMMGQFVVAPKSSPLIKNNLPKPRQEKTVQVSEELAKNAPVKKFTINAGKYYFKTDKPLVVNQGDVVEITFNIENGQHDFIIDELGIDSGLISAGKSKTISFLADNTGEFEYRCSNALGVHKMLGMKGILKVNP